MRAEHNVNGTKPNDPKKGAKTLGIMTLSIAKVSIKGLLVN